MLCIFLGLQYPKSILQILFTSNFKFLSNFSKYIVFAAKLAPVVGKLSSLKVSCIYLDIKLVFPTP